MTTGKTRYEVFDDDRETRLGRFTFDRPPVAGELLVLTVRPLRQFRVTAVEWWPAFGECDATVNGLFVPVIFVTKTVGEVPS